MNKLLVLENISCGVLGCFPSAFCLFWSGFKLFELWRPEVSFDNHTIRYNQLSEGPVLITRFLYRRCFARVKTMHTKLFKKSFFIFLWIWKYSRGQFLLIKTFLIAKRWQKLCSDSPWGDKVQNSFFSGIRN